MRKAVLLVLMGVFLATAAVTAQSTRRKVKAGGKPAVAATQTPVDTLSNADSIALVARISDYKKTVASRVETFLVTNRSATDTIRGLELDIDYRSVDGAQLNRRTVTVRVTVPPLQTRHVSINAWDRQQLFYHVDTPPARKTQRTTPFTVTITPLHLFVKRP